MSAPESHEAELAGAVVGRALHALEPEDESRVDEHLRHCGPCRALLAQTHETMAVLARSVPAVEPPADLRGRILAAAAAEPDPPIPLRRSSGRLRPEGPGARIPDEAGPDEAGPPARELPARPPSLVGRPPRRRLAAVLALAAVVAGIVVFSARGMVTSGGGDPRSVAAARAQQVVASAQSRDPGVRHASLVQPGGPVVAVVLDDASGARVVPVALPQLGAGRTYVLWRVAGGGATAVGTFDATGAYAPVVTGSVHGSTLAQGAYAVSVEPSGPVPPRPSAVVANGALI